jgi:ser/thr/tyr protein kinase RAD53
MAAQICQAIAYIHEQNITHRDLKPENIMLTSSIPPTCKVADFGLSKIVDDATFLKTACGTPAYLAPEVMLRRDTRLDPYTDKVDSYSLGVIFFCMLVPKRNILCCLLLTSVLLLTF